MPWQGYVAKIGDTVFPNKIIAEGGYSSTPNQQTDEDSYVDASGLLHRNVLSHLRSSFKIETTSLTLTEKISISMFYSTINRKKCTITYWNDEISDYKTGDFYIPSVDWQMEQIGDTEPTYKPVTLEFIEY